MATLDGLQERPPAQLLTGIALKVFPAQLGFDVVLERAPDASGSPGTWSTVTRFAPKRVTGQVLQDRLPLNGTTYWYRCKSVRVGYTDSGYTIPVKAVPTVLTGQEDADLSDLDYIGKLPAGTVARQAHGVYLETFEADPGWILLFGAGVFTYPLNGQAGGRVRRSAGYTWAYSRDNIPFDPSKLYRMRARVRVVAHATVPAGHETFFCGIEGVAADGVTPVSRGGLALFGSPHGVCANADLQGATLDEWIEYTGWFKGWAAAGAGAPSTDPRVPAALHQNVRYFRVIAAHNYNAGDGIQELDELAIDVFDEESQTRIYTLSDSSTVISAATTQTDGTQSRTIIKGRQRFVVRDNTDIDFNPVFQNIPQGRYVEGGISYQPNSKWGVGSPGTSPPLAKPQYREVTFKDLTTSGCTVVARLRQKNSTVTARTDNFASGTIDAESENKECNLVNSPAIDSQYLVSWTGSLTAAVANSKTPDYADISVTFAIKSKNAVGSYVTRATITRSCHATGLGTSKTVDIGGSATILAPEIVSANSDIQILITDITITGNPLLPDTAVSLDPASVQYSSGTNLDQVASMTPDTEDSIVVEFEDAG